MVYQKRADGAVAAQSSWPQQHNGMGGNSFFTPDESQLLGGGSLDIDLFCTNTQILRQMSAHQIYMRRHFRCLCQNRAVKIDHTPALGIDHVHYRPQQTAAVSALEPGIGIGKMPTDIAKSQSTKQRITDRMQQHVTIRMRHKRARMLNAHPAQGNIVTSLEAVHIVTMTNTHFKL